ncbi:MAG: hypothetical protein JO041_05190, partial [Acidobacteria bacterium]|nr:hypothetical protein [Acidobacteriota bacterium]
MRSSIAVRAPRGLLARVTLYFAGIVVVLFLSQLLCAAFGLPRAAASLGGWA